MAEVKYILERRDNFFEKTRMPLLHVNRIAFDPIPAQVITWTLANEPVRERSGYREFIIHIEGRSGTDNVETRNAAGMRVFEPGPEVFREFEGFMESYQTDAAQAERKQVGGSVDSSDTGVGPTLILRALWEGWNYKVEVERFHIRRAANESRFGYVYTLDLRGYAETVPITTSSVIGFVKETKEAVEQATDTINNGLLRAKDFLSDVQENMEAVRGAVNEFTDSAQLAVDTARQARSVTQFPQRLMEDTFHAAGNASQAVFESAALVSGGAARDGAHRAAVKMASWLGEARRKTAEDLGGRLHRIGTNTDRRKAAVSAQTGGNDVGTARGGLSGSSTVFHEVRQGETVEALALKFLGDGSLWSEITQLNGMIGPDKKADGSPLTPGDEILVPNPSGRDTAPTSKDKPKRFGRSFRLKSDGDIALLGDPVGGFQLVDGPENLVQSLKLRLQTIQGSFRAHPSVGIPTGPGDARTAETIGVLAAEVRDQLIADDRIEKVESVDVTPEGSRLVVSARARPVSGPAIDVVAEAPEG